MKERREINRGNILGCDKFHHKERSIYHQPNHLKFWKKLTNSFDEKHTHKLNKHIKKDGK